MESLCSTPGLCWGSWWFLLTATLEGGLAPAWEGRAEEPLFSPDLSSRLCVLLSRKAGLLVPWCACCLLPVEECGDVQEFQWFVWSGTVI